MLCLFADKSMIVWAPKRAKDKSMGTQLGLGDVTRVSWDSKIDTRLWNQLLPLVCNFSEHSPINSRSRECHLPEDWFVLEVKDILTQILCTFNFELADQICCHVRLGRELV